MADGFWSLVTVLAFWGWVGGVVVFILSAFPAGGGLRIVPAARWGTVWLLLFFLWIAAMSRA
jgi:hypothetical protein